MKIYTNIASDIKTEFFEKDGVKYTNVNVKWNDLTIVDGGQEDAPFLYMEWSLPIIDIQYQWHVLCPYSRSLHPDWNSKFGSKISYGAPLHVFYNNEAQNRYTIALDDCVTQIDRWLGVHEEDGTLKCKIDIPLDATGKTTEYSVTLREDKRDIRYEDAIRDVSVWWEEFYKPMNVPDEAKAPLYSFWYSFHQQVFSDEVAAECERAAELGMETAILDDGWQTDDNNRGYGYCGDWELAEGKIPDMRALADRAHKAGIKLMIWYSVPYIGIYSKAAKLFEGKFLNTPGRSQCYVVDPRYPEVREYLVNIYKKAMIDWNLDGLKLDFIDTIYLREESTKYAEGMDFSVVEDAVHQLMIDVRDALLSVKEDALIEFRQGYIGPCMREFGNMFRVGDCPNMTITNRVGMVDLRLTSGGSAVHTDMMMWNKDDRVENAVCQMLNGIFATEQISVKLDVIPEDHKRAVKFWIEFMKQNLDLLQNAPIYADSPEDFYPIVWTEKDGRSIIAIYQPNVITTVKQELDEAVVLNATRQASTVVRANGKYKQTVKNLFGEVVSEQVVEMAGLNEIAVPECGFVELVKV